MYKIKESAVKEYLSHYEKGDKVHAIKLVRADINCSLKEAKDLVEHKFSEVICKEYDVRIENTDTIGYWIDEIFIHTAAINDAWDNLKRLGFNPPTRRE